MFRVERAVNFRNVEIEEPSSISFHTVDLRLGWFVDVDPSEFRFADIEWYRLNGWYRSIWGVNDELKVVEGLGGSSSAFLLESACRSLAVNYEGDHRYDEASRLRYCAMDARRKRSGGVAQRMGLAFWYWLLSGYGELQGRALLWVSLILLGFASFYTLADFPSEQNLTLTNVFPNFWQALIYSLGVMTRQRLIVEPEPGLIQTLVILEGILGPLQIALFALAIRRKFIN